MAGVKFGNLVKFAIGGFYIGNLAATCIEYMKNKTSEMNEVDFILTDAHCNHQSANSNSLPMFPAIQYVLSQLTSSRSVDCVYVIGVTATLCMYWKYNVHPQRTSKGEVHTHISPIIYDIHTHNICIKVCITTVWQTRVVNFTSTGKTIIVVI